MKHKLSYWKVRWSIINGHFRTTQVIAYDYEDSRKQFEIKTGVSKSNILTSTKVV
jgi:hypothetical protein